MFVFKMISRCLIEAEIEVEDIFLAGEHSDDIITSFTCKTLFRFGYKRLLLLGVQPCCTDLDVAARSSAKCSNLAVAAREFSLVVQIWM